VDPLEGFYKAQKQAVLAAKNRAPEPKGPPQKTITEEMTARAPEQGSSPRRKIVEAEDEEDEEEEEEEEEYSEEAWLYDRSILLKTRCAECKREIRSEMPRIIRDRVHWCLRGCIKCQKCREPLAFKYDPAAIMDPYSSVKCAKCGTEKVLVMGTFYTSRREETW
jgi:hypothetical protein